MANKVLTAIIVTFGASLWSYALAITGRVSDLIGTIAMLLLAAICWLEIYSETK